MIRDAALLAARTFDVLVVGGGVYGLTIACDAAQRGLAVALVERDDFGSGASFNHLRTIHGGLRYLQTLDLPRARESILERRTLARIAPHAVVPMPFVLPLRRSLTRGRSAMRAAFFLDRGVGRARNTGVAPALHLPPGTLLSRDTTLARHPELPPQGLTGAAQWYDYITPEPDRLTLAWGLAAVRSGATLVNHVEATRALVDGARVVGVRALDRQTGQEIEIRARLTVNATGGSLDRLAATAGAPAGTPMMLAMNLVTSRPANGAAIGGRAPSGRFLFRVPWRGRALFGTWESASTCAADSTPTPADTRSFIDELNHAFPVLALTPADVALVHRGVVPAAVGQDGRVALEGREQLRTHPGREGLLSIAGTKYTTARVVAARVVDRLEETLARTRVPCRTGTTPLPGGAMGDPESALAEARRRVGRAVPDDTLVHLFHAYGSELDAVVALGRDRREWLAPVAPGCPVIGAELVWAVREEMAVTLADAALRRTPLGAIGDPGDSALERAADIVGGELGWSDAEKQAQIADLRRVYQPGRA